MEDIIRYLFFDVRNRIITVSLGLRIPMSLAQLPVFLVVSQGIIKLSTAPVG